MEMEFKTVNQIDFENNNTDAHCKINNLILKKKK